MSASAIGYLIAFVLFGAAASIAHRIDMARLVKRPVTPLSLRILTVVAGIAGIAWLVLGIFRFNWWLPLVGLACGIVLGAVMTRFALRGSFAAGWAIVYALLGLVAAAISFSWR
jgi:energy-converting hydrogenase Eha subunit H